jgi:hypothetical protein
VHDPPLRIVALQRVEKSVEFVSLGTEQGFGVQTAVGFVHVPFKLQVASSDPEERYEVPMQVTLQVAPESKFTSQLPLAELAASAKSERHRG